MKKLSHKIIPASTEVYINSGTYKGEWGTIEDYDGENYYVALWGDNTSVLIFDADEISLR